MTDKFLCVKNTIRLRSGLWFDLQNPQPEQVSLADIAGALSKLCRFGGHGNAFYSVAEHSYHCAKQAEADGLSGGAQLAVLMHDASEAYAGDVVKPLKIMLPEYSAIEDRVQGAIAGAFGIDFALHHDAIREIDRAMLIAERNVMFSRDDVEWTGEHECRSLDVRFQLWTPAEAEKRFVEFASRLMGLPDLSPRRQLIAFCGVARSGKDTAAQGLDGFTRVAFADGVREALLALNPECGPYESVAVCCGNGKDWDTAKRQPECRELLQRMGTEAGRNIHGDDCWIRLAKRKIDAIPGNVVITDVRFANEAAAIREWGGTVVRIERPGVEACNDHASERLDFEPDTTIVNDGTVADLHEKVRDLVGGLGLCRELSQAEAVR